MLSLFLWMYLGSFMYASTKHLNLNLPDWTDKLLNFFEWLANVRATG